MADDGAAASTAYAFCLVLCVALVFLTYLDSSMFDDLLPTLMASLSLFERFTPFVNGMFDMSAVVFYLSVIVFFLFLSVQSMERGGITDESSEELAGAAPQQA